MDLRMAEERVKNMMSCPVKTLGFEQREIEGVTVSNYYYKVCYKIDYVTRMETFINDHPVSGSIIAAKRRDA